MDNFNQRLENVDKLCDRINSFSKLEDGWNSEGSFKLDTKCIKNSISVISFYLSEYQDIEIPCVFPTCIGGIQFEWILGDWSVDINFNPNEETFIFNALNVKSEDEFEREFLISNFINNQEIRSKLYTLMKELK